jgi:hypothetical protein
MNLPVKVIEINMSGEYILVVFGINKPDMAITEKVSDNTDIAEMLGQLMQVIPTIIPKNMYERIAEINIPMEEWNKLESKYYVGEDFNIIYTESGISFERIG